jgi:RNA recognition motif-containing protein
MNICVENLSDETTEDDLRYAFAAFGQVRFVNIVRDGIAGESRVFGFVGMPSTNEAQTAIENMNGKDLKGQTVNAKESHKKANLPYSSVGRQGGSGSRGGGRGKRGGFGGRSRGRHRH